jgi:hypothetical protein
MKGKYKAAIALLLLFILLPLTLLMTLAQWVPTLAGIWLPAGTRIAFEKSPRLTRHALIIADLRYLVDDCEIARIEDARISHPSRWKIDAAAVELNSACLSKIPQSEPSAAAPKTLAEWQSMLPNTWLTIDRLTLSPWQQWQGKISASFTPTLQEIHYDGESIRLRGTLRGQNLTVSDVQIQLPNSPEPVKLVGEFTLPLVPDGLPVQGHAVTTFSVPQVDITHVTLLMRQRNHPQRRTHTRRRQPTGIAMRQQTTARFHKLAARPGNGIAQLLVFVDQA